MKITIAMKNFSDAKQFDLAIDDLTELWTLDDDASLHGAASFARSFVDNLL